jgi:hypothetical protein
MLPDVVAAVIPRPAQINASSASRSTPIGGKQPIDRPTRGRLLAHGVTSFDARWK